MTKDHCYETICFDVDDQVATVTLDRPERMNAWTDTMGRELCEVMRRCDRDDGVRAVVVTGAGRAFCAGADLSGGGSTFDASERRSRRQEIKRDAGAKRDHGDEADSGRALTGYAGPFPWQIRKPVIAAINGHAIGVGITYSMTCDIRLVAEEAKIQFAFTRRGVLPELWSHAIVPRVAGLSNAADLLLSGRMILGREMAAMGLASQALPAAEVLEAAQARAREFKDAAPVSVALSKRLLWQSLGSGIEDTGVREARLFGWVSQQPDAKEGVMSFLEKRAPDWKLRASKDLPAE
jgi:enoyl-CoA hydratase/carnithine racemase